MLFDAVGMVLLIACANIASLLVSQTCGALAWGLAKLNVMAKRRTCVTGRTIDP
jgi:hypothetical protein